jgi:hypothetical protein
MDAQIVRDHADAQCAALLAGDIDTALKDLSSQLRSNMGEVIAQIPFPVTEATVESVDLAGSGYLAVMRLVGESGEIRFETRWKDRDGAPTIVEVSHVVEARPVAPDDDTEDETAG